MSIEDIRIPAMDGFQLAATLYRPDRQSKVERFALITSAMGVKRRYYDPYARFLCEQGIAGLAFDFRGIGDSRPSDLRHFEASMLDWRHLRPRDLGVGAIGHFGFFRGKFKRLLWQETVDWLRRR